MCKMSILKALYLLCFTLNKFVICQEDDSPTANVFDSFDLSANIDNLENIIEGNDFDTVAPEVSIPNNDIIEINQLNPTMGPSLDTNISMSSSMTTDTKEANMKSTTPIKETTTEETTSNGGLDLSLAEKASTEENAIEDDLNFLPDNTFLSQKTTTGDYVLADVSNPKANTEFPVEEKDATETMNQINDSFKKKDQVENRINSNNPNDTKIVKSPNEILPTKNEEQTTPTSNTDMDYIIDEVVEKVKQIVESFHANAENYPESQTMKTKENLEHPSLISVGKIVFLQSTI